MKNNVKILKMEHYLQSYKEIEMFYRELLLIFQEVDNENKKCYKK